MFKRGLLTLLGFLILLTQRADCDLITILACDTHANNLESAVVRDLENIRDEAQKIALYTGHSLKEILFDGDTLAAKVFLNTLKSLEFKKDDIVLFYFSGHGYRTYSKEEENFWPNLFFTDTEEGVDYSQVLEILSSKKQRFLLSIADCCNNFLDDFSAPPVVKGISKQKTKTLKKNYTKLFSEMKGSILITSSSISEYSWSYPRGAIFTLAFLDCLNEAVESKNTPKWKTILAKTSNKIKRHQTPIYLINSY